MVPDVNYLLLYFYVIYRFKKLVTECSSIQQ